MIRNTRVLAGWVGAVDHVYHRVASALWWAYEATLLVGIAAVGFTLITQSGAEAKRRALSSMVVSQTNVLETIPHVSLVSMVKYGEKNQEKK